MDTHTPGFEEPALFRMSRRVYDCCDVSETTCTLRAVRLPRYSIFVPPELIASQVCDQRDQRVPGLPLGTLGVLHIIETVYRPFKRRCVTFVDVKWARRLYTETSLVISLLSTCQIFVWEKSERLVGSGLFYFFAWRALHGRDCE